MPTSIQSPNLPRQEATETAIVDNQKRAVRTMLAITRALLRTDEEADLLQRVTQIAVRDGGYAGAWIGMLSHSSGQDLAAFWSSGVAAPSEKWIEDNVLGGRALQTLRARLATVETPGAPERACQFPARPTSTVAVCQAAAPAVSVIPFVAAGHRIGVAVLRPQDGIVIARGEVGLAYVLATEIAVRILTLRSKKMDAQADMLVHQMAYVDALTGLSNREGFRERCDELLQVETSRCLAVIALGLAHFDRIQSAIGFDEADKLIFQVAERLQASKKAGWLVARLTEDRFAILIPNADHSVALGKV